MMYFETIGEVAIESRNRATRGTTLSGSVERPIDLLDLLTIYNFNFTNITTVAA